MPSDKDIVVEAREVADELKQDRTSALCKAVTHKVVAAHGEAMLRALADEVERLRGLVRHMNLPLGE